MQIFPQSLIDSVGDPAGDYAPASANGHGIEPFRRPQRGALTTQDGRTVIGRIGAPASQEATTSKFHFWIPDDALVEATQIVNVLSKIGGEEITFHGLIEEVHRASRRRGMGHEVDDHDGDLGEEPLYESEGYTYASAAILRTEPSYLTPPRERSAVRLASGDEAQKAYGADKVDEENRLVVGLIKNGGAQNAGPGHIDLDFLLGGNGGHLNVSGTAGRATKSSFLLTVLYLLLEKCRRQLPGQKDKMEIIPVIFNVKNYDLFYLDKPSRKYDAAADGGVWNQLGVEKPGPFTNVEYFAPPLPRDNSVTVDTGRGSDAKPYSWSLKNVIEGGLLTYLFSDDDVNDNFLGFLYDLEEYLTDETTDKTGQIVRRLKENAGVATFEQLVEWLKKDGAAEIGGDHHKATRQKVSRKLRKLLYESGGVLRLKDQNGTPLDVRRTRTSGPIVVDLNGLAGRPALQRFVVAAALRQMTEERTGSNVIPGLRYIVLLDELNRFAPKGGRDPITKLIETVAAEMRSQGIILFGAQQQASLVSARVIENASIKALGATGRLELTSDVWGGLSDSAKRRAEALEPKEKLLIAPGFRQPMNLIVPFPAWAMNRSEAGIAATDTLSDDDARALGIEF